MSSSSATRIRCAVCLPGEQLDAAIALGLQTGFGSDRLRLGHLKLFADGGMGARTAWLLEPYLDAECGLAALPLAELREITLRADRAGLALMIHAVGDRAAREVIALLEELQRDPTQRAATRPLAGHRIEHLQMVRPEDLAEALERIGHQQNSKGEAGGRTCKIIAVAGATGGVGTTSVAVNLGCALASDKNNSVVLVDLDLCLGDADVFLDTIPDYTLVDVAQNATRMDFTLLKRSLTKHSSGLFLLPRPVGCAGEITEMLM